jgi:hypothetical protein
LVSQLREDLLLCSSYLPLGVPNELYLQAINHHCHHHHHHHLVNIAPVAPPVIFPVLVNA